MLERGDWGNQEHEDQQCDMERYLKKETNKWKAIIQMHEADWYTVDIPTKRCRQTACDCLIVSMLKGLLL